MACWSIDIDAIIACQDRFDITIMMCGGIFEHVSNEAMAFLAVEIPSGDAQLWDTTGGINDKNPFL